MNRDRKRAKFESEIDDVEPKLSPTDTLILKSLDYSLTELDVLSN